MIASLPLFHRISGQTVLILGDGEAADAKRKLVERSGAVVSDNIAEAKATGARLAFVAVEDDNEAQELVAELRSEGWLVNSPDRPQLCDFTIPSILDRDPVLIAVGTGGASAGLAKHLRLRLERILPRKLGDLAKALYTARESLRARFPDGSERRRALDDALREGGVLDPFVEQGDGAVSEWLDEASQPTESEHAELQLVSDDPEDLTLRQARLLGEADTIVLADNIPDTILARARADAVYVSGEEAAQTRKGITLTIRKSIKKGSNP